jgi:outer membrane receptor for ferrienterochelin and colicins
VHHWPGFSALFGADLAVEQLSVVQQRWDAGTGPREVVEVPGAREGSVEPWVQGDLRLLSDRLEFVPGLRLSIQSKTGAAPTLAPAPSLSVRLKLWRGASLRLSGSRGYRAPSLKERHLVFDHAALGYIVIGDPALLPESTWGVQGSWEQKFLERCSLRLGGFAQRMDDLITYVYDATASSAGLSTFQATNLAQARTAGANVDLDLAGGPVRGSVAYRFLWAVSGDGYFLPDSPIHTLRGTFDVEVPRSRTRIGTTVSVESERYVDPIRGVRSPASVIWDLRVEQPIPHIRDVSAFLTAENLLNQHRDPKVEGDMRSPSPFRVVGGLRGSFRTDQRPDGAGRP